ncbi:hypothetical protein Ddc_17909 [Ditylenchus destructor]|nr:hypothetical protein Ddc_17909 [Ditylenchus destructor]
MSLSKPRIPFEPILETLSYLGRNELELISITSRFFNQVIRQNFRTKPYRILLKEPEGTEVRLFAELNTGGARSSADLILSSSNLMRCRHLIINNHSGILLRPHTYPMLYKLRILELSKAYAGFILDFIHSKTLYPESKTILIVSAFRPGPDTAIDTLRSVQGDSNMFAQIRKDFITSSAPNNFALLINFRYESNSVTFDEFRKKRNLENPRTKEVLQFAKSGMNEDGFSKKLGLPNAYSGYSVLERFSV